jgi:uncharacterized protein YceK
VEDKILVLLLGAVVISSGCTSVLNNSDGGNGNSDDKASNGGLEVVSFEAAQDELRPGQKTQVKLVMENKHVEEVQIAEMSLYNFKPLNVPGDTRRSLSDDECTPSSLRRNLNSNPQRITCTWTVEAPSDLGDFDSKTATPKLRLAYESKISNSRKPIAITFKDFKDVSSSSAVTRTVDNGEVKMTLSSDSPVPLDTGAKIDVELENAGHGKVLGPDGESQYTVDFSPDFLFSDACSSTKTLNPAIDASADTTCQASPSDSKQAEYKIVVSASYKYQKTPNLNIEVTN